MADIDVTQETLAADFKVIASELESRVKERIPHVAYCSFYITPKFAY